MSADTVTLPSGLTLVARAKTSGCSGCWFDAHLGGCIGFLSYQPGCGDLTRADGQNIIWVQKSQEGGAA